jgi:4-hydroxyphenylpyruvate dioxygenase
MSFEDKMVQSELTEKGQPEKVAELPINSFDHVELYVGNALQAAYYYQNGFGFDLIAFRGLETGERQKVSYVLKQNDVTLILTGSLKPNTEITEHVSLHGDGVKTIALQVQDASAAYSTVIGRGAKAAIPYAEHKDENGLFRQGSIHTYGATIHTFVERQAYKGAFAPGFKARKKSSGSPVGLLAIDHVVGNVEVGKLPDWIDFYRRVFGFRISQKFDSKDISTQYSSLISAVMANASTSIKLPINEPAEGLRKSQIQEYLDYYQEPGVQHIAISTANIIDTVKELRNRGIKFLTVPKSYYESLPERVGKIDENVDDLAALGILVDREAGGYLLQIFTKPVQDRPTLFFEIIQRKGATGFGKGNFKALFEAIENEQARRGNL